MSFESAYKQVALFEGTYSNNPKDSGGETYCGISRKWHPSWPGWPAIDAAKPFTAVSTGLKKTLAPFVESFYRKEFWEALRCPEIDFIHPAVAAELFEASVNCGKGSGAKFLQRALNVLGGGKRWPALKDDGQIGPATMSALKSCLSRPGFANLLVRCQNGEQYIYYKNWSGHADFPGVFARIDPPE